MTLRLSSPARRVWVIELDVQGILALRYTPTGSGEPACLLSTITDHRGYLGTVTGTRERVHVLFSTGPPRPYGLILDDALCTGQRLAGSCWQRARIGGSILVASLLRGELGPAKREQGRVVAVGKRFGQHYSLADSESRADVCAAHHVASFRSTDAVMTLPVPPHSHSWYPVPGYQTRSLIRWA